ncbi:hypothetical protein HELRODRAFT_174531 [Helobdella robusta]|uniref:Uncharacterized protein n=1 Tax=Helobdella robusta TaxID=6412 RepID=T1F882_HELRO|nr:hypothetical protein HELRODRAFT_174531 [Helobdella robusta]ESO01574.1 hypothetical protein HELRODRAFT_174531 [Helobdella robusta]
MENAAAATTTSDISNLQIVSNKRKLILHVDVRNTIIVADSVTKINVEQALNSYLTGVLWGRESQGKWEWVSTEPSLTRPEPNTISYYKHLEKSLVSKPEDRGRLRMETGDFTTEDIGVKFREYYEKHLELLKWRLNDENVPGKINNCMCKKKRLNLNGIANNNEINSKNNNSSNDDKGFGIQGNSYKDISLRSNPMIMNVVKSDRIDEYHYILPSFVKLISYLLENNRNFSIIIRTYGQDAPNVLSSIRYICRRGKHPNFPRRSKIAVNTTPGHLTRSDSQPFFKLSHFVKLKRTNSTKQVSKSITIPSKLRCDSSSNHCKKIFDFKYYKYFAKKLEHYKKHCLHHDTKLKLRHLVIKNENDISQFFNNSRGISGYVDDFIYWQKNGYNSHTGKPLWLILPGLKTYDEFFGNFKDIHTSTNISSGNNDTSCQAKNANNILAGSQSTKTANRHLNSVETHHHIFFDDNIRVDDEDNIVDIRLLDKQTKKWRSLTTEEIKFCENIFLVQASLMESIENENYFIDNVNMCERNLENILQLQQQL